MSDLKKPDPMSLRVGDFLVKVVPVGETSDALDTEANRERAQRAEEDQRAAQFGAGGEGAGRPHRRQRRQPWTRRSRRRERA